MKHFVVSKISVEIINQHITHCAGAHMFGEEKRQDGEGSGDVHGCANPFHHPQQDTVHDEHPASRELVHKTVQQYWNGRCFSF